jgi:hypothetical protein
MRMRILSALFLSLILIIGAAVLRSNNSKQTPAPIVSVDTTTNASPATYTSTDVANLNGPNSTSTEENLTTTDVIGRQLITDYVNLAASGQATEESIDALALRYVEGIKNLNVTNELKLTDINIVPDTRENLKKYSEDLSKLINRHGTSVDKIFPNTNNLTNLGEDLADTMNLLSSVYADIGTEMKSLPVPASISQEHLNLVNYYISSSESIKYISYVEEDPALSFAGIVALNDGLEKESSILSRINDILSKNGL